MATSTTVSSFGPWLLGLMVVSIPVVWLQTTSQGKWAWSYVMLVLISIALYHADGFVAAMQSVSTAVKQ